MAAPRGADAALVASARLRSSGQGVSLPYWATEAVGPSIPIMLKHDSTNAEPQTAWLHTVRSRSQDCSGDAQREWRRYELKTHFAALQSPFQDWNASLRHTLRASWPEIALCGPPLCHCGSVEALFPLKCGCAALRGHIAGERAATGGRPYTNCAPGHGVGSTGASRRSRKTSVLTRRPDSFSRRKAAAWSRRGKEVRRQ
jgi:hypothetical protein